MKQSSMESAIRDIVRRLDTVRAEGRDQDKAQRNDDPFQDVEALAPADPVLASLHKHYLEANIRHKMLLRENGFDDPMAEIAADILDSSRSAMQTRLLELQEICAEELQVKLQHNLRARRAEKEKLHARKLLEKRKKDKDDDLFFWFVVFYWLMNRTIIATRKRLSAANDFALVSDLSEDPISYAR